MPPFIWFCTSLSCINLNCELFTIMTNKPRYIYLTDDENLVLFFQEVLARRDLLDKE